MNDNEGEMKIDNNDLVKHCGDRTWFKHSIHYKNDMNNVHNNNEELFDKEHEMIFYSHHICEIWSYIISILILIIILGRNLTTNIC